VDREGWLERVAGVRKWTRAGERAPHKPLLMLYTLGRLQNLGSSRVSFAEAEPVLQRLLDEFGPAERKTSPA
jgi:putative restriction endonuclease